jgi:hypothetical protein
MGQVALGYSQITGIDAAAKSLSQGSLGAIPAGAVVAYIEPEGASIRFRDDGTDPTALLGFIVGAGNIQTLFAPLWRYKLIGASPGAKVNVIFYKS